MWSQFGSKVLIRPDAARLRRVEPMAVMLRVAQPASRVRTYASTPKGQDALVFAERRVSRLGKRSCEMSDPFWLTDEHMVKLVPSYRSRTASLGLVTDGC